MIDLKFDTKSARISCVHHCLNRLRKRSIFRFYPRSVLVIGGTRSETWQESNLFTFHKLNIYPIVWSSYFDKNIEHNLLKKLQKYPTFWSLFSYRALIIMYFNGEWISNVKKWPKSGVFLLLLKQVVFNIFYQSN